MIVVLVGGYTAAERTLFEAGKWHDVRHARLAWQDSMEVRFIDTIEGLTHRTVTAFLSANRQDPDISVELFVLDKGHLGAIGSVQKERSAPTGLAVALEAAARGLGLAS